MKCQKYRILGFFKEGLSQILLVSFLNSLFHIRIIFSENLFVWAPAIKWDKVFRNGPSEIYGRQSLKNLKGYGLLKQTISLQIF